MDKSHLAACHMKTHRELFLYTPDGSRTSFRSPALKDRVEYLDTGAPANQSWDDVAHGSKDYIWAINCPIYSELQYEVPGPRMFKPPLANLLDDGWNILKPGGKLIFRGHASLGDPEKIVQNLFEWNKKFNNNPWKADIVKPADMEYYVHDKLGLMRSEPIPPYYFVLTKPVAGGRRRRTRRRTLRKRKQV